MYIIIVYTKTCDCGHFEKEKKTKALLCSEQLGREGGRDVLLLDVYTAPARTATAPVLVRANAQQL